MKIRFSVYLLLLIYAHLHCFGEITRQWTTALNLGNYQPGSMPDIHVGQDGVIKIAVTGSSAGTERTIIYRLGANGSETGRTDIDSGLTTGTFRGNKTFSPDGHFVMLGSTPGDPSDV